MKELKQNLGKYLADSKEGLGEGPFPCFSQVLEVPTILNSPPPYSIFKANNMASLRLFFHHHISLSFSSMFKGPCYDTGSIQIIQDNFPSLKPDNYRT